MASRRFVENADFYLTRAEFAARVGLAVSEVKRQETMGNLIPAKRNSANQPFYKKSQLDAFLENRRAHGGVLPAHGDVAPYTSEEAARVFTELDKGRSPVQIVEMLKVHPRAVRAIASDYYDMKECIVLTPATIARMNRLPLDGAFPLTTEADVFAVMENAAKEQCLVCGKAPKRYCQPCAVRMTHKLDALDGV